MSETTCTRRRFVALAGGTLLAALCSGCEGSSAEADDSFKRDIGQQESACPRGLLRDPYPGRCGLYRDRSNSGYCDLSEV